MDLVNRIIPFRGTYAGNASIITLGLTGLCMLWKSINKFIMNYLMFSCYLARMCLNINFPHKYSQKHSSPVRARFGVSFLDPGSN